MAERVVTQADADEQRRRADYAEVELSRYQAMGPQTEGSSSSLDLSQLLHNATQERDTLLTEGLRVEIARLLETEVRLQAELAAACLGDERVRAAEERARVSEEQTRVVEAQTRAAEAHISQLRDELATERATVIRLQADLLQRRSRSATASGSMEIRLRRLEEELMARSRSHSRSVRHSSMSQVSAAPRAAMPSPPAPIVVLPPEVLAADDAQVEGVGTSAPAETQDAAE